MIDSRRPLATAAACIAPLLLLGRAASAAPAPSTITAQEHLCYGSAPRLALDPLEAQVFEEARIHLPGSPAYAPELSLAARDIAEGQITAVLFRPPRPPHSCAGSAALPCAPVLRTSRAGGRAIAEASNEDLSLILQAFLVVRTRQSIGSNGQISGRRDAREAA
jgi:hypothetical protein